MKRLSSSLLPCLLFVGWFTPNVYAEDIVLSDADLYVGGHSDKSYSRTSVHDPSIFMDTITNPSSPVYYVIGSHLGFSRTSSLDGTWTKNVGGGESGNCSLFANPSGSKVGFADAYSTQAIRTVTNYQGETVDFQNFDAHAWQSEGYTVQGNQWAPDVIYNPNTGKWLMYMSVNGDHWCSSIVCLSSSKPTGPWVYQGPVVISGFQGKYAHNGFVATDDWKKTDLAVAIGCSTLPSRYKVGDSWGSYWPNCIDPCVFFDEQGELWMSYGSWSGGIWILPLDKQTGLRDYTKQQPLEYISGSDARNQKSDPYFGRKIADGWYVSGEGSYIEHFGDYYYLFVSYGFYSPDGGYEMRVFRSENPDGPYVDCKGNTSLETKYRMNYGRNAATNYGMKLMGGYQWDLMSKGELAQGHNSAFTDKQGRSFLIYHTKFNDGTVAHEVRIHQLFFNQDGWPVVSPYEYHGETVTQQQVASSEQIANEEIPGEYQFIYHKYNQDYANMEIQSIQKITLTASGSDPSKGTVSGNASGSWKRIAGTDFIELTLGPVVYKGVLSSQKIDYSTVKAVCISALSSSSGSTTLGANNYTYARMLWCSKATPVGAISCTKKKLTVPVTANQHVTQNLTLPTTGWLGATVTWTSSDASILTNTGYVKGNGYVDLTLSISKDGYRWDKVYPLQVGDVSAIQEVQGADADIPTYDLLGRRNTANGFQLKNGKKILIR